MSRVLIIGNGTSRMKYNLKSLIKMFDFSIGCNEIYTQVETDKVVVWDFPAINRFKDYCQYKENISHKLINAGWYYDNVCNSGQYAIVYASYNIPNPEYYLIGFDIFLRRFCGSLDDNYMSNVYATGDTSKVDGHYYTMLKFLQEYPVKLNVIYPDDYFDQYTINDFDNVNFKKYEELDEYLFFESQSA